jgi:hypothetical protein
MVIGTSRCAHVLRYLFCCRADRGFTFSEVLDHRGGVRRTGDAQRSCECPPPDCQVQTLLVGMQPCTPTGKTTRRVDDDGVNAISIVHGGHSNQFRGQLTRSASDTRSHRSQRALVLTRAGNRALALDHGSVYRHDHRRKKRVSATPRGRPPPRSRRRVTAQRRCGCRFANPSSGRPAARSDPPCRSPATAGSRAPPRGPPSRPRR